MSTLAVAATAPFGADVLERLAAHHEITRAADAARRAARARAQDAARRPRRRWRSGSAFPCCSPTRPEPGLDLGADTVVVAAYGLLDPGGRCSPSGCG